MLNTNNLLKNKFSIIKKIFRENINNTDKPKEKYKWVKLNKNKISIMINPIYITYIQINIKFHKID